MASTVCETDNCFAGRHSDKYFSPPLNIAQSPLEVKETNHCVVYKTWDEFTHVNLFSVFISRGLRFGGLSFWVLSFCRLSFYVLHCLFHATAIFKTGDDNLAPFWLLPLNIA